MFIKHTQKSVLCDQANVLRVLYKHVPCSMYPKHEPQPHYKVQSGCGCSSAGGGVQKMPVARVLRMPNSATSLRLLYTEFVEESMKSDMCIKQYNTCKNVCCLFKQTFCMCFINMYDVRCSPNTSDSHILKFKVAVATVPWVSVFKMCLWHVFWACQIRQHRFE